jgi:DNA-binding XRE family transcriptional regulator
MNKFSMSLAKNIKRYRQDAGLSQDKLSKKADVTLHTITKIELGATLDPRIITVKRIADALNCKVDDLLKS